MLCVAVEREAGRVNDNYWNYLLRGPMGAKMAVPKKPDYPTLSEAMWVGAHYLSNTYEKFEPLPEDVLNTITIKIGDFEQVTTSCCIGFVCYKASSAGYKNRPP